MTTVDKMKHVYTIHSIGMKISRDEMQCVYNVQRNKLVHSVLNNELMLSNIIRLHTLSIGLVNKVINKNENNVITAK